MANMPAIRRATRRERSYHALDLFPDPLCVRGAAGIELLVRGHGRPPSGQSNQTAYTYTIAGSRARNDIIAAHECARLRRGRRLPPRDHGLRILLRTLPEQHAELLSDGSLDSMVG